MLAGVQVGAADATGERLDQHLPRRGFWLGQGIDDDLAVPENGCAHASSRGLFSLIAQRITRSSAQRPCWDKIARTSGVRRGLAFNLQQLRSAHALAMGGVKTGGD